ncbi:uncharacterized protein V1518DRAFT_421670 [Limtongia smithiae]|uniref:uncharacterized protein n=1 Tax=Limtongia smithiae TaxID=1125753 RepID=UPI0034CF5DA2
MRSLALVAALVALPAAMADDSDYQSYTFSIPTYSTPHYYPDPAYSVTPKRTDFSVETVHSWGNLTDWEDNLSASASSFPERRRPATYCSIGSRSFWIMGLGFTKDEASASETTLAMGRTTAHPSWTKDVLLYDEYGDLDAVVPYTLEENSITPSNGMIHIPRTHCAQLDGGASKAVQFWDSWSNDASRGSFIMTYEIDETNGTITVVRPQDLYSTRDDDEYTYGLFAAMTVQDVVYMYALDSNYGSHDVHVAAAPVSTVTDKSTWTYYLASNETWTSTEPLSTERRKADAVYSLPDTLSFVMDASMFNAGGSIFYSPYHDAYLMVFVTTEKENYFIVEYAATPVGPWSTKRKTLWYNWSTDSTAALATPSFLEVSDDGTGGKSLILTPARSTYVTQVLELTFS